MFAVIQTGGKQYKVEKGSELDVELLSGKKEGDEVSFGNVLMLYKKGSIEIGDPYIKGAEIKAKVLQVAKDKKVIAFKFKRKTNYHRTKGHRQTYTRIKIESIGGKE